MKQCTKCKQWLDESMFNKNKDSKDGLYSRCRFCTRERAKQYNEKNKEKRKKYYENYWLEHKIEKKIYDKQYTKENKDKIKMYQGRYKTIHQQKVKERKEKDIHYKLDLNTQSRFSCILSGKQKTSPLLEQYNEYTVQQLRNCIESQFTPQMSWNNYGTYWELDHIVPRFKFYYESYEDEQFKQCWALSNLRPLTIKENRERSKC